MDEFRPISTKIQLTKNHNDSVPSTVMESGVSGTGSGKPWPPLGVVAQKSIQECRKRAIALTPAILGYGWALEPYGQQPPK